MMMVIYLLNCGAGKMLNPEVSVEDLKAVEVTYSPFDRTYSRITIIFSAQFSK